MNQSETNFYTWLLNQGYKADQIRYNSKTTPDFIGHKKRWEVKKKYDNMIILYSQEQVDFIEQGGENDFLVVMPNEPSKDKLPLSIMPCNIIKSVDDRISFKVVEKYSPRKELTHWFPHLVFNVSGVGKSHHVYIRDKELEKWVESKIRESRFRTWSHAVEVALKLLRSKKETESLGPF